MRRLVRPRVFNNARTASRNLDLPPAIGRSPSHPQPVYCMGGFRPVYGGNTASISASAGPPGRVVIRLSDSAGVSHIGRKSKRVGCLLIGSTVQNSYAPRITILNRR